MEEFMHPDDITYKLIQQNFCEKLNDNRLSHKTNTFKQLQSDRQKWNFINEARSFRRCKTETVSLKKSFGGIITDLKRLYIYSTTASQNSMTHRIEKKTFDEEIETRVKAKSERDSQISTHYPVYLQKVW